LKPHNSSDSIKNILSLFRVKIGTEKKCGNKKEVGKGDEQVKNSGNKVENSGEKN
jgi:hypothetical protein